jgi:hypothetical protein
LEYPEKATVFKVHLMKREDPTLNSAIVALISSTCTIFSSPFFFFFFLFRLLLLLLTGIG